MHTIAPSLTLHDFGPEQAQFREEVLQGLRGHQKTIPCKYFYDEQGSHLFDRICELDEYYPTRTEAAIMQEHGPAMAAQLGPGCLLVEYGSGSSRKTRILLDHLDAPAAYVPVDISREHLCRSAAGLSQDYLDLDVLPVCADYTQPFALPTSRASATRTIVYFPGSTIGNFHPSAARRFLARIADQCGEGGGLLIGVDLKKAPQILEPAYNDRAGVTAAFNLNVLARINRELGADFALDRFAHHAFYNEMAGRIEMHLVSLQPQTVRLGGVEIAFEEDESIWTECSYKYCPKEFARLAASAGWDLVKGWTDAKERFSVQYLTYSRVRDALL